MKLKITELKPNPFRKMDRYPIDRQKVDALKTSIHETRFWENILSRPSPDENGYEIAYGHHRLVALRELLEEGKIADDIDISVADLDDAMMIRVMANENMETWGINSCMINESVLAAKEYLDAELGKFKTWKQAKKLDLIKSLDLKIEREQDFTALKAKGVGQPTLLKFLGGNWKQWMVQQALEVLKDKDIDRSAVEKFSKPTHASAFRRALKREKITVNKKGKPTEKAAFTRDEQRKLAENIIRTHENQRKEMTASSIENELARIAQKRRQQKDENSRREHRKPQRDPEAERAQKLLGQLNSCIESALEIMQKVETLGQESNVEGLEQITSFFSKNEMDRDLRKLTDLSSTALRQIQKKEEKRSSVPQETHGKINRLELLEILGILNIGVSKASQYEQTTHYLFVGDHIATSCEWVTVIIPFHIGFKCSVKARPFFESLSQIPDEWIQMEQNDGMLVVKGQTSFTGFKYFTDPPDEHPRQDPPDLFDLVQGIITEELEWETLPNDLIEAMKICSSYASKDPAAGPLTALSINDNRVLACNRTHAMLYKLKRKLTYPFLIVPPSVDALVEFDSNCFGPYSLHSYCLDSGWTLFRGDDVILAIPNWAEISRKAFSNKPYQDKKIISAFPTQADGRFIQLPTGLSKVLQRMSRIHGTPKEVATMERKVRLEFSKGTLCCSAQKVGRVRGNDTVTGWHKETLVLEDGPDEGFTVWTNADMLSQGIKHAGYSCYIYAHKLMLVSENLKYLVTSTLITDNSS